MAKSLFRLLLVALLGMIPAAILITGNAAWTPVYTAAVCLYTAFIATGAIMHSLDLRAATGFKRSDFGEKAHERIKRAHLKQLYMSTVGRLFTPVVGAVSVILSLALNVPHLAGLVAAAVCTVLLARGSIERYARERCAPTDRRHLGGYRPQ